MGKRKHKKDTRRYAKKRWKRVEERFKKFLDECSGSSDSESEDYDEPRSYIESGTDERHRVRSVVAQVHHSARAASPTPSRDPTPAPSRENSVEEQPNEDHPEAQQPSAAPPSLPTDILDALGDPKGKVEKFGPNIQTEISECWGRILSEGLNKDQKQALMEKVLKPENFALVKAPKLNQEIAAVLTESARNRDTRLEKSQHQLGLSIAHLTNAISVLISSDTDKVDLIKQLSETNQILLDLHYENTINRQKLITPILDKKFLNLIQDTKRDTFIFGEGLGDKIKAVKTAQNSGLHIKKKTDSLPAKSHSSAQQGNWRGPPRQIQRSGKAGRGKYRPSYQAPRRTGPPASDRYQPTQRAAPKPPAKKN